MSSTVGPPTAEDGVDLVEHAVARVGVERQQVPHPRERVGRRLVAGEHERGHLVADALERQRALLVARVQEQVQEVVGVGRVRLALVDQVPDGVVDGPHRPLHRRQRRREQRRVVDRPATVRIAQTGGATTINSRVANSAARRPVGHDGCSSSARRRRTGGRRAQRRRRPSSARSSRSIISTSMRSPPSSRSAMNASIGSIIRSTIAAHVALGHHRVEHHPVAAPRLALVGEQVEPEHRAQQLVLDRLVVPVGARRAARGRRSRGWSGGRRRRRPIRTVAMSLPSMPWTIAPSTCRPLVSMSQATGTPPSDGAAGGPR